MSSAPVFLPANTVSLSSLQLSQIAELIYDTDPYIYPALFSSKDQAVCILSRLFCANDSMFCPENLFICLNEKRVIGIILWHQGPLFWNPEPLCSVCDELNIMELPYLNQVKQSYFDSYANTPENTSAIINVCVAEPMRGKGIGQRMLEAFLAHPQQSALCHRLVVLTNNDRAVHLYKKFGFHIESKKEGFALERKPEVFCMFRDAPLCKINK